MLPTAPLANSPFDTLASPLVFRLFLVIRTLLFLRHRHSLFWARESTSWESDQDNYGTS